MGEHPRSLDRRPPEAVFLVKARLRDGKTIPEAQVAMDALGKRLAADYPNEDPGKGIVVFSSRNVRVHPQIDAIVAPVASILLIIVGLTLAIACSNLATLLLVRGASRSKEVSVRLAIGATRGQIVRHLLMESLILAVAGGAAGCILAHWAVTSLSSLSLPILVDLRLDYRVLGFTLLLSLVTGVAFGLAPALTGHSDRSAVYAARRGNSAVPGAPVVQPEERTPGLSSRHLIRAALRDRDVPRIPAGGPAAGRRLPGERRRHARDGCAIRRLLRVAD